ncbi:AAA family ATPase [Pseudanabaenaceae cyanobacterium LEGE 13415]|nr:AAA family ATPase [Pseudanabaenaceae cyanobacterium LEGE 13415]
MSELFKGFEQLLELAKVLEEKAEKGELKANVQINRGAAFSSIPRNTSVNRSQSPSPEVIVTPPPANPVSLQNVGGLREVLQELRELVELPLKRPEVLAKLGLEPIRGVLLAGSPGTGKTLTARSLSEELGVNYIAIAAPEVMGKYYGEAEARLRSIFEKAAASTPCIIFIDEIDSLAPDRSKVEGEVEKRVVAQLLTLMDGFAQTKGVIVLAATNRPDHLDPALRRPGRFDREIQFRVPDRNGRLEILEILTRSMPLNSVDLGSIADQTVGMVGADLKAVCQKAAYIALRRQVPSLETVPNELSIEQSDFVQALKEIKPSVLRSVEVESPNVKWDQIGGLEDIKRTLQEAVEGAMLYPELFQQTGAKAPRGILLWGLPGTGKTLLAKAVASQARANFIAVNGAELMSRWVGAAEQEVRDLFNKARQASRCVVFIDEIDTLAPARGKFSGDSGVSDRVVGQLLTELDGLQDCGTVLLIGATNRPDELDPALLRSGRLDLQIEVSLPNTASRFAILQVHNVDRPLAGVDLTAIAQSTEGWNGADLALLSNQAALQAIRRYRAQGMTEPTNLQITGEDFEIAYQALISQRRA